MSYLASSRRARLRSQLAGLKLPGALEALDTILAGVGKTQLAIGLVIAAAQHGCQVHPGTLADLLGGVLIQYSPDT